MPPKVMLLYRFANKKQPFVGDKSDFRQMLSIPTAFFDVNIFYNNAPIPHRQAPFRLLYSGRLASYPGPERTFQNREMTALFAESWLAAPTGYSWAIVLSVNR